MGRDVSEEPDASIFRDDDGSRLPQNNGSHLRNCMTAFFTRIEVYPFSLRSVP
jgi:hypothetical protein